MPGKQVFSETPWNKVFGQANKLATLLHTRLHAVPLSTDVRVRTRLSYVSGGEKGGHFGAGVDHHASLEPFPLGGRVCSERPGAVKGAPLLGAAKRTLDGEDRSATISQEGKAPTRPVQMERRNGPPLDRH